MGKRALDLLEAFDGLSPADKQAFAVEVLRRTRDLPFDSGPLDDDEIGLVGRSLMSFLDKDEDVPGPR